MNHSSQENNELDKHLRTGFEDHPPKELDQAFLQAENPTPPKSRSGRKIIACAASDISPGERRIIDAGKFSIGLFNLEGNYYAIRNECPHLGAPLCQGTVHSTHRPSDVQAYDPALENRVIRCPWHGWEFDIISGKGLYSLKSKIATYQVDVDEDENIIITL